MGRERSGLIPPTIADVFRARAVVRRFLEPTPLIRRPALDEQLGFDAYLKCENLLPIGAFKLRGGIYLMSRLSDDQRARGVVTASTGNHGQSIAYAGRLFGIRTVVYAPEDCNPVKAAAMRRLGAELVLTGRDFDDARLAAEERARTDGFRYIHSANEPDLIAGVGTYALELAEQAPELDAVIVPVGAGSGVCGTLTVFGAISPGTKIIGVQSRAMPVVYRSWRERRLLELDSGTTFAEGLSTRVAFELPLSIMCDRLSEFRLVDDAELCRAIALLLERAQLVAEGAGAASLAAGLQLRDELAGKRVGLIVSGGNITLERLRWALAIANGEVV